MLVKDYSKGAVDMSRLLEGGWNKGFLASENWAITFASHRELPCTWSLPTTLYAQFEGHES
jgi:hypothetical protein